MTLAGAGAAATFWLVGSTLAFQGPSPPSITPPFARHQPRSSVRSRSPLLHNMVRNIDLVEAVIFYGQESFVLGGDDDDDDDDDDDEFLLLPGVEQLLGECQRDDTAVLALLQKEDFPSDETDSSITHNLKKKHPIISTRPITHSPPNPRDLWEAIHSIEVQPKGFGGSSGFGTKAADPERPPLPQHCVVLATTEDQCRAARYAGMRVLCLTDNDLADGVLLDGRDWSSIGMDDIATPGSFWLNPPHPRDDGSNAVDVEAVIQAYDEAQDENEEDTTRSVVTSSPSIGADTEVVLSDAELANMLADIDPL